MLSPPSPAAAAVGRAASLAFLLFAAALPWSIAPMSIGVGLCAVATLAVWFWPGGPGWCRTPAEIPSLAWLAALVIASIAGQDVEGSIGRVTKGLLLAVVPMCAFHARDRATARRALAVLLASAAVATVFALVKFVGQGGAFPIRVRGAAGHPLTYGGQAMLLATVAGAIVLRARSRRWRLAAAGLLLLVLPALLGSYTRSAWIGTLAAFAVLLAFTRARWLLGLAAGAVALLLVLPGGYRERALSAFNPNSVWNVERVLLWKAGWRMFEEHPVTGVGLQDLHPLIERYRPPGAHEKHGHLHSIYVQIAATMGLVGLTAFGVLVWGLYRTASRGLRPALQRGPPADDGMGIVLQLAAVAALSGFLVAGLFEWNFGDEELLDFLFLLIGMAFGASGWAASAVGPGTPSENAARPSPPLGVPS